MIGSSVIFGVNSKDVIARLFGELEQEVTISGVRTRILDKHGIPVLDPPKKHYGRVGDRPRAVKYV